MGEDSVSQGLLENKERKQKPNLEADPVEDRELVGCPGNEKDQTE